MPPKKAKGKDGTGDGVISTMPPKRKLRAKMVSYHTIINHAVVEQLLV